MPDKQLLPGRERQRIRPGLATKEVFERKREHVTIGECHRYYAALLLDQWKSDRLDEIDYDFDRRVKVMRGDKRQALEERRSKRIEKVNSRAKAPNTPTYHSFCRYFNYLIQLGYVERETLRATGTKPGEPQRTISRVVKPRMRGPSGPAMAEEIGKQFTDRLRGGSGKPQIEPPVTYRLTAAGEGADWSDPAGDWRRGQ